MKQWKVPWISLFVAVCIFLNAAGRQLAVWFNLPLWLDSFGTVLAACLGGPFCGSVVGLTGNVIYGAFSHTSFVYGLTSVALGTLVGLAARRRVMETMFGAMTVASIAALAATAVSVPLNLLFYAGRTGNEWGNGVMDFLMKQGWQLLPSMAAGQFYVDFLDKVLTLTALFLVLRFVFRIRPREDSEDAARDEKAPEVAKKAVSALLLAALMLGAAPSGTARAADYTEYNDYVQTVFASNNGLPCGEANDIAQTKDGILWIGTYAGLYRYNGREFRWMDGFESVKNVNCLYVDAEGRLWIGTNDNGLSIAINEEIVNVIDQDRGFSSNSVRSIVESSDGYYYIGTTGSMEILTLNSGLKKVNSLWEVNYADQSAADDRGHVAAVNSSGKLFLLRRGQILSALQIPGGQEVYTSCCFDPKGRLLAGTSGSRVEVYDISGGGFAMVDEIALEGMRNINHLYYLRNGELFIAADNGVGYIDTDGRFHPVNTNDFDNSIDNTLIDYQGNLWFTSSRLGLLRLAPSAFRDIYSTIGLPRRVVNAVAKWQGHYCFGTDKGLDVVDAACRDRVENALSDQLMDSRIRCLLVDSRDSLWICTYGGGLIEACADGTQYLYNSDNGSFGNRARMVFELSDGTILAAGDTGISFIADHAIERTIGYAEGLINSMILTVTEMPDGTILAGTDGDGIAVLEDRQVTRMYTRRDGLSSEVILRTVRDSKGGGVYIVTSNGLCYMDADGAIRPIGNFPYFNNYDIWEKDADTLYVMSSAGIYVVDRDELLSDPADMAVDLLDSRQGLNSSLTANAWPFYDEDTGELFLPCDNGVFAIDTLRGGAGAAIYRMSVSAVRLDNALQTVERSVPIDVARGVSKIEFLPEIINYTIQVPYVGYWLEGFDSGWTIEPQNALSSIVYTNLPSGSYVLHLAVFDNEQQKILEERQYRLVKEMEIYDHKWFKVYMVLVPMLAVAWLTWYIARTQIQRTLARQQRELSLARQQVQMGNQTIFAIAKAVDAKDERTSQHSQRVSEYSVLIAKRLGFSDDECENLRKAALMHDIGKIGIPDSILNKPARLTDEEYSVMKSHVDRGADILKEFTLVDHVVEGARHHHERYDGRGYPAGLKGEDIPLYGRIIGVADAFDAMTANRVYRRQMDFGYVLNEMRNGRGTQFDPHIVDIMLSLIEDGEIDLNKMYAVPDGE